MLNLSPTNYPLLPGKTLCGAPNTAIQYLRKTLAQWRLFVMIAAALNLENSSVMWNYHKPGFSSCRSRDTVSLKSSAFEKAAIGRGFGFLNLIHVLHESITFLTRDLMSLFNKFASFENFFHAIFWSMSKLCRNLFYLVKLAFAWKFRFQHKDFFAHFIVLNSGTTFMQ